MIPRSLRHRLEKAAKALVLVQKHFPKADCSVDIPKGENGHLQLDFVQSTLNDDAFKKLGKDLEGKGYTFTKKDMPWIGQVSYKGKSTDKTTIVFTLPATIDRLAVNDTLPVESYSFS